MKKRTDVEKLGCVVGGLEGKCLGIWVDSDDWDLKDTMVEKLRLKANEILSGVGIMSIHGEPHNDHHIRLCQFFEENTKQTDFKSNQQRGDDELRIIVYFCFVYRIVLNVASCRKAKWQAVRTSSQGDNKLIE